MELKGKKINFLGDSITQGVGPSAPENVFVEVMKRNEGLAEARNYGISATRIACQSTAADGKSDGNYCARALDMDPDADIVVVFGGTNDYGHGDAPLGTFDDRTRYTFWGACHELMRSLMERYPHGTIVILTPTHRLHEKNPNCNGVGLETYVDIIKEAARYYSLPVLDLFAMGGIQPDVETNKTTYMPDGLHPNDAGNRLIAERLAAFLRAL